ncbi:guanine nucleotide-binding protein-like 3 homolog [Hetaerina americana]|uniref:guanine nucleotide-binding protein-like 3 homolog n=1 Tax=Hetaerina americana TaxID=62018 RepID=UPI003A7F586A
MAKGFMKKQSKRIPARKRYKIEKRVKEHNKRLRKEARKNQNKNKPKPIEIPNICPFKEQILEDVAVYKSKLEEEREKRRQEVRENRSRSRETARNEFRGGLDELISSAEARGQVHDASNCEQTIVRVGSGLNDGSAKAYCKEFHKVVDAADVILEVVDARDPLGTRCRQVENAVLQANKRLIIVLNKADLVPQENLLQWLKYLRRSFPAVAFKASTQQQASRLGERRSKCSKRRGKGKKGWQPELGRAWSKAVKGSPCLGAGPLFSLLSGYCSSCGPPGSTVRTSIRVGVVGLPNVGKSSVINSLKRKKACQVGATPGVTKSAQEIHLDSKIRLLDSPGIVFAAGDRTDESIVLKNATRVDVLEDPVTPAAAILKRTNKEQMMELYKIPSYSTPEEFLALHAAKMGRLKKGGVPDVRLAARCLIDDWNRGHIKYYTLPPEIDESSSHVSAAIVDSLGAEFDPAKFEAMEMDMLNNLSKDRKNDKAMLLPSGAMVEVAVVEDEEMNVDGNERAASGVGADLIGEKVAVEVVGRKGKNGQVNPKSKKKAVDPLMSLEGNLKLNKLTKLQFKKLKKAKARNAKQADAVSGAFGEISLEEGSDNYDFTTDFSTGFDRKFSLGSVSLKE